MTKKNPNPDYKPMPFDDALRKILSAPRQVSKRKKSKRALSKRTK
jgi:hypothetical protein